MNTNKTFKKFVINLLKCRDTPLNSSSTAVVSQAYRNPSAVTDIDNKVIRNSTCAVEYNQNGPKFVASSGFLRADRGFRRSQSDTTKPKSLSPQNIPQRVTTGKIPNLQGPECPEYNDSISVVDSEGLYSERGSDDSNPSNHGNHGNTSVTPPDLPNTENIVRVSLQRSSSAGSIHSGSVRSRKNGSLFSRSLENFANKTQTEAKSPAEAKSYKLTRSPKSEFQRIVDYTSDASNGNHDNTVTSVWDIGLLMMGYSSGRLTWNIVITLFRCLELPW